MPVPRKACGALPFAKPTPSADDPGVIFLSKHLSLKFVWGITTEMTPVSRLMTPVSQGHGLWEEASEFWMGTPALHARISRVEGSQLVLLPLKGV
jgi:hypothetical protein